MSGHCCFLTKGVLPEMQIWCQQKNALRIVEKSSRRTQGF
jgi:hypothetical protein